MPKILIGSGDNPNQLPAGPVIKVQGKTVSGGREVDLGIIFDTTGSMSSKISALVETCLKFVDEPVKFNLDPQFTLISFGDISYPQGGDTIEVVVPLTPNIESIKQGLQQMPRNSGFGNLGESSFEAVSMGLAQPFRPTAVKVIILITDEPALFNTISVPTMQSMIASKEVLFYAVTPDLPYFKQMAKDNGGEWLEISATSTLDMLKALFARLAANVARVSSDVHRLAGGNVKAYLQLKSGN